MTKNHCPLGEDCDLLIAYEHGLSSARDIILQNGELEAERDEARMQSLADLGQAQDAYEAENKRLREALRRISVGWSAASARAIASVALGETEK